MRVLSNARLRTRLVLIALTAVIPAVAVIVYEQFGDREAARARAIADAVRMARAAAAQQASAFNGAHRLLLTLAEFPDLRAADAAGCRQALPNILRDHPGYVNIVVLGVKRPFGCVARPIENPSVRVDEYAWFKRVMETKQTAIGDYQIAATDGEPTITIAHPLLDKDGEVERIVIAGLKLDQLSRLAAQLDLPPGGLVTLFDRN